MNAKIKKALAEKINQALEECLLSEEEIEARNKEKARLLRYGKKKLDRLAKIRQYCEENGWPTYDIDDWGAIKSIAGIRLAGGNQLSLEEKVRLAEQILDVDFCRSIFSTKGREYLSHPSQNDYYAMRLKWADETLSFIPIDVIEALKAKYGTQDGMKKTTSCYYPRR